MHAWSHSDWFSPLKTKQSNQGIWQTQIILNTLVLSGTHIPVYTVTGIYSSILLWYGFTILNNDFSIIHLCIISYCQHNTDKYVSIINWWQVIDAVGMHNSFNLTAIQLSFFLDRISIKVFWKRRLWRFTFFIYLHVYAHYLRISMSVFVFNSDRNI